MAVNATFKADFSNFLQAIDQAEIALVDFGKGASTVEKQLNRMVDNFSGRKLIQEASLLTIAVEKAGGVAALTAKELQVVGAKANEAAEKMQKLGYEVPKGLQDLADATKKVESGMSGMSSAAASFVGNLAAMAAQFVISHALEFGKAILEDASTLKDLSRQTQISTDELQVLANAMADSGVDAEELGRGMFNLSKRIAKGDDSVAAALQTMGLSLDELRSQEGQELFLTIEKGLAKLQGSLRDETAATLFGDKLGMAMAGASTDIESTMASAQQLNQVLSSESIDALDTFGESIEKATHSLSLIAAQMVGPVAQGFNVVVDAAMQGASKWEIFKAMLADAAASVMPGAGSSATNLATLLDHLNQQTAANEAATKAATVATAAWQGPINQTASALKKAEAAAKAASDALKPYQAAQEAISLAGTGWVKILDTINGTVVEGIKYYLDLGVSQKDLAALYGVSETQVKAVAAAMKNDEAATQMATDAKKRHAEIQAIMLKATNDTVVAKLQETQALKAAADAELAAALQAEEWWSKKTEAKKKDTKATEEATKATGVYMNQLHMLVDDPKLAAFFGGNPVATTLYSGGHGGLTPEEAASMAAGIFINAAVGGEKFWGTSGRWGGGGYPGRAGGGPVSAGQPYMVGEQGPELFVPSHSGRIAANGGGLTVVNTFHVNGTAQDVARQIADVLNREVMQGRKLSGS